MLLGDDLPPVGGPAATPRARSLLNLSSLKTGAQAETPPAVPKNDDFDFPPLFPNDKPLRAPNTAQPRVSILNSQSPENQQSPAESPPTHEEPKTRPPRLLLRAATPTQQTNRIIPEITQPIPQAAVNPVASPYNDPLSTPIPTATDLQYKQPDISRPLPPPPSPTEVFEKAITSTLDRSINQFKRSVVRDVTSVFRPTDNFDSTLVSNFMDSFTKEIQNTIENLDKPVTNNSNSVVKKITLAFDDGINPIKKIFNDVELKNQQQREQKIEDMTDINNSLSSLLKSFKDITTTTVRSLDRARIDAATQNEQQQTLLSQLNRQLRSHKIRSNDLESKHNRQTMELESIERFLKQAEDMRKDAEEERQRKQQILRENINKQFELIIDRLSNNPYFELETDCKDIHKNLAALAESIRDEVEQMDYAEQQTIAPFMLQPRPIPYMPMVPIYDRQSQSGFISVPGSRSPKREFPRKDLERRRVFQENDSFDVNY